MRPAAGDCADIATTRVQCDWKSAGLCWGTGNAVTERSLGRKTGPDVRRPVSPYACRFRGKPYRYAYSTAAVRPTNMGNALARHDLELGTTRLWYEPGCMPGEYDMLHLFFSASIIDVNTGWRSYPLRLRFVSMLPASFRISCTHLAV